jgi:hypothetical protein
MPDLNLTPLKCHNDAESYVTWLKNLGAHVPPTTLRYAGSMNPTEPPLKLKNFNGREANGSSRGPERPHRGGSSYVQLSAKIEKLKQSSKKMKRAIYKKKCKRHNNNSYSDGPSSSWHDLLEEY